MRRSAAALAAVSLIVLAAPAAAGAAAPGGFAQLANPLGCLLNGSNAGGVCTQSHDLGLAYKMVISPDGKNAYVAGVTNATVTVYDRNQTTGKLTQKTGLEGCVTNGAATATCKGARHLGGPLGMAFNKSGSRLYVSSYNEGAVLTFNRDSTGRIAQRSGAEGCIANTAIPGDCDDARALTSPREIATDPQGKTLYATDAGSDGITALAIDPADGTLSQISDGSTEFGCVQGTPSECGGDGLAMSFPWDLKVSPDGNTVYLGTLSDRSVVAFARNPNNGRIRPLPAPGGCLDAEATDGCGPAPEIGDVFDIEVSANSSQVYVPSDVASRVLVLDRSGGTLTRRAGASGCVSQGPDASCGTGHALGAATGIALPPDGAQVYVGSDAGLSEVTRTSNGGLAPRSGSRSCAAAPAESPCAALKGVTGLYDVEPSPDGKYIYGVSLNEEGVAVFKRDTAAPTCSNASATISPGQSVTLTLPCSDADADAQTLSILDPPPLGSLGSVNQSTKRVLFASSGVPGTSKFRFRTRTNGINSNTATYTINIVAPPPPPPPPVVITEPPPPPLVPVPSTTSFSSLAFVSYTKFVNLSANNLVAGSTVTVSCKTKKKGQQKKGCPYKSKRMTTSGGRAKLNLRKPFNGRKVPVGTKLTITISAPGYIDKRITYTIRKRKRPSSRVQCIAPGGKPGSCV